MALALLLDVAHDDLRARVDRHIEDELVHEDLQMLQAFHPVIEPANKDGEDLRAVHAGNELEIDDEAWSFPELVHGRDRTAGGTRHQGWSAAAAVIAHEALNGRMVFGVRDVAE